mgnify:CR=1 FL=1
MATKLAAKLRSRVAQRELRMSKDAANQIEALGRGHAARREQLEDLGAQGD